MLPSIGFAEMIVLALLAIIVVGPKDLPKLMRTLGRFTARIRAMGQEFKDAFDDMDEDGEIAAMRREIQELKNLGHIRGDLDDLNTEMRQIGNELREGTDLSSPHAPKANSPMPEPPAPSTKPDPTP